MSYSFDIGTGDLSFAGPGGLAIVTAHSKLFQDIRCALLEPIGSDPMHPEFGSALDGGVLPDGTIVETNIGSIITKKAALDLESEIRRVLLAYQQNQLAKIRTEQMTYGGIFTFDPGEILLSIVSIDIRQVNMTLVAKVVLQTADNQNIQIALPVGDI